MGGAYLNMNFKFKDDEKLLMWQVAEVLGMTVQTIYKYIANKDVQSVLNEEGLKCVEFSEVKKLKLLIEKRKKERSEKIHKTGMTAKEREEKMKNLNLIAFKEGERYKIIRADLEIPKEIGYIGKSELEKLKERYKDKLEVLEGKKCNSKKEAGNTNQKD